MKGLLLKECYILKSYRNMFILYLLLFGGVSAVTGNIFMFSGMAAVFLTTVPMATFTHDEAAGWNRMAGASPVGRRAVVRSKYLLGGVMLLAVAFFSLLVVLATGLLSHLRTSEPFDWLSGMVSIASSVLLISLGMLAVFPVLFKYGAEKGRMAMMLIFGSLFGLIMLFALLASQFHQRLPNNLPVAILVGAVVVLPLLLVLGVFVSYRISLGIYTRKDL